MSKSSVSSRRGLQMGSPGHFRPSTSDRFVALPLANPRLNAASGADRRGRQGGGHPAASWKSEDRDTGAGCGLQRSIGSDLLGFSAMPKQQLCAAAQPKRSRYR